MAKFIVDFDFWCKEATRKIKYRPDRQDVYSELHQHLQDRYQYFIDQGMEPEEAVQKALQAMGDAKELAPVLAAIHRPFWGYMYTLCKWIFFLSVIIMLYNLPSWLIDLSFIDNTEMHTTYVDKYNVYTDTEYEVECVEEYTVPAFEEVNTHFGFNEAYAEKYKGRNGSVDTAEFEKLCRLIFL